MNVGGECLMWAGDCKHGWGHSDPGPCPSPVLCEVTELRARTEIAVVNSQGTKKRREGSF